MRDIIKAVKTTLDASKEDPNTPYAVRKSIDSIIEALVEKTVKEMTWRGKMIKDPEVPESKKEYLENNINWLFKNMKPFEEQLRGMHPELKDAFDQRELKVLKMDKEFIEKKKAKSYKKSW